MKQVLFAANKMMMMCMCYMCMFCCAKNRLGATLGMPATAGR